AAATSLGPNSKRKREKGPGGGGGGGQEASSSSSLSVDRRKSKVWNYYTKLGDAYVECNVCKKQLSFHNSTTTMREHLVRKHSIREAFSSHPKEEQVVESDPSSAQDSAPKRCRQAALENIFQQATEARGDIVAELLVEMIFQDLRPLSTMEDKGFGLLLGFLEPGFQLPTSGQLEVMLRKRYQMVKQNLECYLQTAQGLVVTLELWRSWSQQLHVTITANFIDGEWRRARCALETRPLEEEEEEEVVGDGLKEKIHAVLSGFGLSTQSIFCLVEEKPWSVTGDRRRPRASGGWRRLPCAAHALHLCV
ncbi:RSLE3 protein, partial [Galbula dea]|nr:RSLE3 protein [Galbula dea]